MAPESMAKHDMAKPYCMELGHDCRDADEAERV